MRAVPVESLPSARRPLLLFHELFLHPHLGANDALARELFELGIGKSEQAGENFAVMFAEGRRGLADRKRFGAFTERHRGLRMLSDEGAINLLDETAGLKLR